MRIFAWHKNNLTPESGFEVEVKGPEEARARLSLLADYDLALGDAVSYNMQGLAVERDDGEIEDWEDEQGRSYDELEVEGFALTDPSVRLRELLRPFYDVHGVDSLLAAIADLVEETAAQFDVEPDPAAATLAREDRDRLMALAREFAS